MARIYSSSQSKVLAFAFGLSAEIERKLISQRTKEALDRKRAEGHQLGRPKGSKNKHYRLEAKDRLIQRLTQQGVKMQEIASRCRVSYKTLYLSIPDDLFHPGTV